MEEPESKIQARIMEMLERRGWCVIRMPAGIYQSGIPDLYAAHPVFGSRWIEVKRPTQYSFTKAQKINFPKMCCKTTPTGVNNAVGIWVLTGSTEEDYKKLFCHYNWVDYLK